MTNTKENKNLTRRLQAVYEGPDAADSELNSSGIDGCHTARAPVMRLVSPDSAVVYFIDFPQGA